MPEPETVPFPPEGVVFRRVRYQPCEGVELRRTATGYRIVHGPYWWNSIATLDDLAECIGARSASSRIGWFSAHPEPSREAKAMATYLAETLDEDMGSDPESVFATVSCGLVSDEAPPEDKHYADVATYYLGTPDGRRYRLTLAEDTDR